LSRVQDSSCGHEVMGELVIAGGDAPPIFDATEEALDFAARPKEGKNRNRLFL
jgi:hypothetical protein